MKVDISRAALDAILQLSERAGAEECCGLLLGHGETAETLITDIIPTPNVAADRRRHFEIDPALLIRAHRAEREESHRILGCYHSHPGGNADPSTEDAAQAAANGWLWLICAGDGQPPRLWRAVAEGAVHGRFDAVEMCVDSCIPAPGAALAMNFDAAGEDRNG